VTLLVAAHSVQGVAVREEDGSDFSAESFRPSPTSLIIHIVEYYIAYSYVKCNTLHYIISHSNL